MGVSPLIVVAGCSEEDYSIAIAQYVEHPSLDATREGMLAALEDAGFKEGSNLTVEYNNAQADSTNNLSIAQDIATKDYELVLPIATPAAQAVIEQVENVPVLFSAVTNPLDAQLVDDLEQPGGNVTGGADTNPEAITMLMDFIAEHFPDVDSVGVVINEGEPNAAVMAEQAEEALAEHEIELIRASVPTTSEVQQAAESLVGRADAIYITLDNMVVSAVDSIIDVAEENDIPFFSSDRDTVEAGSFATVGFDYYDHGYQVGQMAEDILKNGTDPGEMPVTFPDQLDYILNLEAAEAQGIEVTDAMQDMVNDSEENIIE
ncbi:ABC transporter substrate-binding protein [Virgibacillus saliphilus]|uniref:ABC transporter substrate-binding protein n=1 Tax=Virgibacillus saliphilus TaxID=2831674 RepID=UPI0035CCEA1E